MTGGVLELRRAWRDAEPLAPQDALGRWRAEFVAPLRLVAPWGLGLIGLPRWHGKQFRRDADGIVGVNLLHDRRGGRDDGGDERLREHLPMTLRAGTSLADGRPALVVGYPAGSPRPWPWVRDELRRGPDGAVLAMTYVDVAGLRRLGGTPFLLHREPDRTNDAAGRPPVPFEVYRKGVYLHGTKADLAIGDLLVPGRGSNFEEGRVMNHVYFTETLDAAAWGAELAVGEGRPRIYVVEPTAAFEDDPNVTDKRFPGNPTRSYRSRAPLRVVGELDDWVGHEPAQLVARLESLAALRRRGEAVIED